MTKAKNVKRLVRVKQREGAAPFWNPSRLRLARAVTSTTLTELASATGISRATLHDYEGPLHNGPKPDALVQLSDYFSVPAEWWAGPTHTLELLQEWENRVG